MIEHAGRAAAATTEACGATLAATYTVPAEMSAAAVETTTCRLLLEASFEMIPVMSQLELRGPIRPYLDMSE